MARRRMFSLDVVDTDQFLDMSPTAQNLYFHLGMRADDDGFVSSPKKIVAVCRSVPDDLKLLVAKGFVIPFEDGVILITDWRANNYIRKDRYIETRFKEYLDTVEVENDKYILASSSDGSTCGIPKGSQMGDKVSTDGCHRIGKDRIGKINISNSIAIAKAREGIPTYQEVEAYCEEHNYKVSPSRFFEYNQTREWKYKNGKDITDWQTLLDKWESKEGGYSDNTQYTPRYTPETPEEPREDHQKGVIDGIAGPNYTPKPDDPFQ